MTEIRMGSFGTPTSCRSSILYSTISNVTTNEMSNKLTHEKDVAANYTNHHVDGSLERVPQRRIEGGNIIPVKTEREESKTFVTRGTTEEIGEDEIVLVSQAEDGNTGEDNENVFRKEFPDEHANEDNVPNTHAVFGLCLVAVNSFKKSGDGQSHGPKHLCWVDDDVAEETSNTETEELRGQDDENTSCLAGVTTVEQFLCSQCFSGESTDSGSRSHNGNGSMFLLVERVRVEVTKNALARDRNGHGISENVCNDSQEDQRHENGLGLEIEDFLEDRRKDRKTHTCTNKS